MSDFGATGKFPHGKLNEDDEGELQFGVGHDEEGCVHIKFGTSVKWLAMPAAQAIDLADLLKKHAQEAAKKVQ